MKIGIISDTHVKTDISEFVSVLNKHLWDVDLIIHAGDYTSLEAMEYLKVFNNFTGVCGNVDEKSIKESLQEKEIMYAMGYKIGIYHGHGSRKTTPERAYECFSEEGADIIIFGHSHQPSVYTKDKTLMINPGSLMNKRKERWHSFVILQLEESGISAAINFI